MNPLFTSLLLTTTMMAPLPPEPKPDPLAWGYLGVRVSQGTMFLDSVEPDTPAKRAGLFAGDEIIEVGLLKPKVFQEVQHLVCDFRPGTKLKIVVKRGEKRISVTLQLAARPSDIPPPDFGGPLGGIPVAPIP